MGPIPTAPGSRTAATKTAHTQQCRGWKRLARLPAMLCWSLGCFLLHDLFYSNLSKPQTSHVGTALKSNATEVSEVFGGVAGRKQHSCTPKRRTARGDRETTGGRGGQSNGSTVASGEWCDRRRAGQRWLGGVGWGVIGGLGLGLWVFGTWTRKSP